MSEEKEAEGNDYVATAAAEKRLREVMRGKFGECKLADDVADVLLAETRIEYKPRLKAVQIQLPIPAVATNVAKTRVDIPLTDQQADALASVAASPDVPPPFPGESLGISVHNLANPPAPTFGQFWPKPEPADGYEDADLVG